MARAFPYLLIVILGAAGIAVAGGIHHDGLDGPQTAWVKGAANVPFVAEAHEISTTYKYTEPASEYIRVRIDPAPGVLNPFVYYRYSTPPAPVTDELACSLRVRSSKPGVQLLARVVLPRERNPDNLDEPLTVIIHGDATLAGASPWQRLEVRRPVKLLKDEQQLLRAKLRRDVITDGAYVDQLILNLHTGPGVIETWVDDLAIGPVLDAAPTPARGVPARTVSSGGGAKVVPALKTRTPAPGGTAPLVEFNRDQLRVGGKGFLFRGIRYSDTPMAVLKNAGLNTLIFDGPVAPGAYEEAVKLGFKVVPTLDPSASADALTAELARYPADDPILFWNLGTDRSVEGVLTIDRAAKTVRGADLGQRPVTADVSDGFWPYSSGVLDLVGTHRWPLMTGMDLFQYRDYLVQRRNLARPGTFVWTYIQTHAPDWYLAAVNPPHDQTGYTEPFGPQAEQIRLLTYTALAAGCRGLAFWSDRALADDHQGRDRLLAVALLNQELQMLEPFLIGSARDADDPRNIWIDTSDKNVKAAVLRGDKGVLVLPLWVGGGAQFVPGQAAARSLTFTVPQVPIGTQPWEVTPGDVRSLQCKRVVGGVEVTLPEFGLSAAVAFTSNMGPGGVEGWQTAVRKTARSAAEWSIDLARVEITKAEQIQKQLESLAPTIPDAAALLRNANERVGIAKAAWDGDDYRQAYREAQRALRPLRILMRAQWEAAVKVMGPEAQPVSSPYSVSFYTLPRHWQMWKQVEGSAAGANTLPDGDFERDGSLPGWTVQTVSLEQHPLELTVQMSSDDPHEGRQCLLMKAEPKKVGTPNGLVPGEPPAALERTYARATSPASQFPVGSLVRVSGWVKVPMALKASVDGALLYDTAAGEPLAIRLTAPTKGWKQFVLYRRVPASGLIQVVLELRGLGTVYFDDVRVEPLVGGGG